jgi:hypothetical protein
VLVDGNNSSLSSTLARFNTMGNLLALCGVPEEKEHCDTLLKFDTTGHGNTLGVAQSIAKAPWKDAGKLFGVFDRGYVAPKTANPQERKEGVTYVPYLSFVPTDWALSLKFTGGGLFSPGRMGFDPEGNMWAGSNWMPGAEWRHPRYRRRARGHDARWSGLLAADHRLRRYGHRRRRLGHRCKVSDKAAWLSSFNSTIGVFDFNGEPLGPEEGITFDGKLGQGQGVGVARNGDVWIDDFMKEFEVACNNFVINARHLPTGTVHFVPNDGKFESQLMLAGGPGVALNVPWEVAVDSADNVWVGNFLGTGLFHLCGVNTSNRPNGMKTGEVIHYYMNGSAQRVTAVQIDPAGNVWYANNWNQVTAVADHDPDRRLITQSGGDGVLVFTA